MATKKEGFLQKIDPQMWLTLIGFVFTLGIIYGEFQTMKNQITIFEEKQKSYLEEYKEDEKERSKKSKIYDLDGQVINKLKKKKK